MPYSEQDNRVPAWTSARTPRPRGLARAGRRGIASLLAMLYLVIFATLALGFYAAVTTASQLAHNDERSLNAQVAAESGLQFIQYELTRVRVPGIANGQEMLKEVHKDLLAQQSASDNVAGRGIALTGGTIQFPAGFGDFIPLDAGGAGFRGEISDAGDGWIRVKVHGRYRGTVITRAIVMHFESVNVGTEILDYAIVTRGPIHLRGNPDVGGRGISASDNSVLSLFQGPTPLVMTGKSSIAGDVYMTNPRAQASVAGGSSVGGSSIGAIRDTHIHSGKPDPEPEFPTVDSSMFLPYVTSTYRPNQKVYRNVRIPRNTNPNFSSDVVIEGVLYVETPNDLKFSGKASVRGVIVVANGPTGGDNTMKFTGQFEAFGIETLPATADFPAGLRALTGTTLLAPGYDIEFGGGAATLGGTLVADAFSFHGHSGGVVNGTLIALSDAPLAMNGNPSLSRIKPTGPLPAGLIFNKTFRPIPQTYSEIRP
jgi:hypothetical protein